MDGWLNKNEHKIFWVLIAITLGIFFAFGFNHISRFEVADEHYWISKQELGRTAKYWWAIRDGRFSETYVNDKPGITVALICGPALLFEADDAKLIIDEGYLRQYDPAASRFIFALYRIPILIFNGLFSLFFLWALLRLTGDRWLALWGWMLTVLSPVLVGISQIVNPDSLLWSFSFASILSFLLMLEKGERRYIWLAALMFGLAMLTKYVAIILIPFFLVTSLLHQWYRLDADRLKTRQRMLFSHLAIPGIVAGGMAVFAVLLPAAFLRADVWRNEISMFRSAGPAALVMVGLFLVPLMDALILKSRLFHLVFTKTQRLRELALSFISISIFTLVLMIIANWSFLQGLLFPEATEISFDLERDVKFWSLSIFNKIALEMRLTIFTVTPLILIGWLAGLFINILNQSKFPFLFFAATGFAGMFYAGVIREDLLITARYGIVLYPVVALLAALGWYEIASRFKFGRYAVTALILLLSVISLWSIAPFYFNYSNILLHPDRLMATAWGYGGYEAAEYLNKLPGAEKMTVWSDYRGFCPFFKGKCLRNPQRIGEYPVDYFVKTRRGTMVNQEWPDILKSFVSSQAPVWRKVIDGREKNYIEIYAGRDAADQRRVFERPKKTGELDDFGKPIKIEYED